MSNNFILHWRFYCVLWKNAWWMFWGCCMLQMFLMIMKTIVIIITRTQQDMNMNIRFIIHIMNEREIKSLLLEVRFTHIHSRHSLICISFSSIKYFILLCAVLQVFGCDFIRKLTVQTSSWRVWNLLFSVNICNICILEFHLIPKDCTGRCIYYLFCRRKYFF